MTRGAIRRRLDSRLTRLGDRIPTRFQWSLWLAPLLPLVFISDLTALLWLGGTALVLLLLNSSRAPTFAFVWRSIPASAAAGIAVGSALHFLIDPVLIPASEWLTASEMDLSQFAAVEGDAGEYMSLMIVALLFGGIIEEVTFRGFFVGWGAALFGQRWQWPLAILVAFIFGWGHWYQGPAGALVTGFSGLLFGALYIFSGRKLLPAITAHMAANFWGVTDLYLYGP